MANSQLRVGILSSPGMGHLIPVLVLGNRLVTHHNVKVTIFVISTSTSRAESQVIKHAAQNCSLEILEIPPLDFHHLIDSNTKMVSQIFIMVRAALGGIRATIAALRHRLDFLIADLFCTAAFLIADEFNLPKYVYVPTNAWFTALTAYCHVLDKEIEGQYVDQKEPLKIPGCKSVRPEDVVDPMLDRFDPQYGEYVNQGIEFAMADGILINTWEDLEVTSLKALRENGSLKKVVKAPVHNVGPLRKSAEPDKLKGKLLEWLDMQPPDSVLYVSFGSGGTLTAKQITELAWGLELSQQKFIWVVRPPVDGGADGAFFTTGQGSDDNPSYLPDGFLRRTRGVGFVVQHWAPQMEILSHPSIGGFLSHCGWNSSLECITNGVPMIAWPLYAEQRMNATMLTEELGVAVRPEVLPTKKVVEREEVEKLVRKLMQYKEGRAIREKVKKLKLSGDTAISIGGSSYNTMCKVLKEVESRIRGQ